MQIIVQGPLSIFVACSIFDFACTGVCAISDFACTEHGGLRDFLLLCKTVWTIVHGIPTTTQQMYSYKGTVTYIWQQQEWSAQDYTKDIRRRLS